MTAFALLSPGAQTAIWALLFDCMAACVGLLVYKIANSAPARSLRGWCVLLAAASLLLAGVMPRQMPTGESVCPCRWPWAAPVLCAFGEKMAFCGNFLFLRGVAEHKKV